MRFSLLFSSIVTTFAFSAPSVALADSSSQASLRVEEPPPAPPAREPTSVPRRTVGEALTIIGLVEITVGAIVQGVYAYETRPGPPNSLDGGCRACFAPFPSFVGFAILGGGALHAAVGIPLWITGALPKSSVPIANAPAGASLSFAF